MTTEIASCQKKAERFLKSCLKDNSRNSEEAAVYFLSRDKKDEAVSNAVSASIKRWRNDDTSWKDKTIYNATRAASILRLMQWEEIGAFKELRDNIFQNLDMPNNHDFLTCHRSNNSAFFPLVFPLFTSDIAIREMSSRLNGLIYQWQDLLTQVFNKGGICWPHMDDDLPVEQILSTLTAAFVFGAYRLHVSTIDESILSQSVQYLMDNQSDSGLWGDSGSEPGSEHTVLAAMGIHALFAANPFGAKRCMENAGEWLLRHQQSNGSWYHLGNPERGYEVHATVLAMDAIDISHQQDTSHPQVTFTIDRQLADPVDVTNPIRTVGKVKIDYTSQVIVYKGQDIRIAGSSAWDLLVKLLEAKGKVVTHEDIKTLTDRPEVNVIIGELKKQLVSSEGETLANAIKNQRNVGYYIDLQ